jgi:uncharacterized membrane protein (UPF0127 family)
MRAINQTQGTLLCARLSTTRGSLQRMRGLLNRAALENDEGLLFGAGPIFPLMWMHTFFMRFAIDIVFLDRNNRIIKIDHALAPWRLSSLVLGAAQAIELAAGAAQRAQATLNDKIVIETA